MTDEERKAMIAYLTEQRRHLLAQAKAAEVLLLMLDGKEKCYNSDQARKLVDGQVTYSVSVKPA